MPLREKETPLSVDTRPNVAGAVETVESHLHPTPSYDIADHPMPSGREEVWRFSPVRTFKPLFNDALTSDVLDWDVTLPDGVTLDPVSLDQAKQLAIEPPVDRVAALAVANASYAAHLVVAPEVALAEPLIITGTGTGGTVADWQIVEVGRHASATIVFQFTGTGAYAAKYDVRIGDGANVNLVYVNDWSDDAIHGAQLSLEVGRDARVRTIQASMGGKAIRVVERARYAGPGGELEQFGLYFVDSGQHIEHRLFVDHNAPKTKSNVDYRGALQGEGAHSVWIGDVLIRKVAEGIETYEANKNLVLTDGCQADSVPNLEIETGEIAGAGHSSTTGRFDDEQLFYLKSRGIPDDEARRLVVHGFFADIIRRIGVPDIEAKMLAQVEKELSIVHGSTATAGDHE